MIRNRSPLPKRARAALLLPAGLALGLAGCLDREPPVERATREKILLLNNGAEPKSLDPHIVSGVPEHNILTALLEGLVIDHPARDGEVLPGVAERWEMSADARVWTFHLRREARWSNGEAVTAGDFLFAYERILSPRLGADYAEYAYVLKNAEAFNKGRIADFSEVGVKAPGDHTLELTLAGPTPHLLKILPHYAMMPVPRKVVEAFGRIDDRTNAWAREGNFVGNGPFRLKSWRFKHMIEVGRNPHYWNAAIVKLNGIRFFPIDSTTTEERSFRNGQLHVTEVVPLSRIDHYRGTKMFRSDPLNAVYFYRLNVTRKPLADLRVRRALALAIDRASIVRNVLRGTARPAHGLVPPAEGSGYQTPDMLRFDPGEARRLLAEAGFPGGNGFPEMNILINTHEAHRRIAVALQEMWKRYLNVAVTVRNEDWQVYLDTTHSLDYDIGRAGWQGDYLDPATFLDMWMSTNGNNDTGWGDARYDALLREAGQQADPRKRLDFLRRAETLFLEELPAIPIYWHTRTYLIRPEVKGWFPKFSDTRPYQFIDLVAPPRP